MRCKSLSPLLALSLGASPLAHAQTALPVPEPGFQGKIDRSLENSVPSWPAHARPRVGAPNIVVILLDDIGFADTSTFGGLAQTPELDKLAETGLRYNNFNTAGMCSPTRAALLSGRNHHRVGFGVADRSDGFPGYDFRWKKNAASVADVLRRHGYSTGAFGKWHNTPTEEINPTGPFDRWPTGLGFEYFYGFMGGIENQWEPSQLFRNTLPVAPPKTAAQGYHLTADLSDEAIAWIRTHQSIAPEKPYFLYYATGAVHEPHHAPAEWIARYRGRFDRGWDVLRKEVFERQKALGVVPANAALTPRPKEIPAWSSLSAEERRLYSRQMEVYAAFVAHTDHEIGRLIKAIKEGPDGDNTAIFYIVGDNGSTGEVGMAGLTNRAETVADQLPLINELGGPRAWNQYSAGWAWLGATPFQWWKGIASHFGGLRNPMVVSWPVRVKAQGALRRQFTHVADIAPTIYDIAGITPPESVDGIRQLPLDGASIAGTFDSGDAPAPRKTQYFEMIGNRSIYSDGWMASAPHLILGFTKRPFSFDHDRTKWQLYNLDTDFSQAHDLSSRHPEKLEELKALFDREAWNNNVYPLGAAIVPRTNTPDQTHFVYRPGIPRLQKSAIPRLGGRSYRIRATVILPATGAEGTIMAYGSRLSGFTLFVKDGRLVHETHQEGARQRFLSDRPLAGGPLQIDLAVTMLDATSGEATLSIDGAAAGRGHVMPLRPARYDYADVVWIGDQHIPSWDDTAPVMPAFNGRIDKIEIDVR